MKSHSRPSPALSPGWEREEVKARPPTLLGRAGGQGRGGRMVGTHSVEFNTKNSVHPLDEATEYLV